MFRKWKELDWKLVAVLVLFMLVSTMVVHSAIIPTPEFEGYDIRTALFYILGFIIVLGIALVDYRALLKYSFVIYGIGLFLIILLFFIGAEVNGAKSWFKLPGGLLFQPAELVKLVLILISAYMLGKRGGEPLRFRADIIPAALIVLVPFVLVLIQPDLGNAIIYLVVFVGMLWIAGTRYKHVLIGITTVLAALILFVTLFNTFNDQIREALEEQNRLHWYQRINTFLNPGEASSDDRHQSSYAIIAIGTGELAGDGFKQGELKNNHFIPYPYSDSIFVVIGEEFGFLGSAFVLLMYFALIYRLIRIAAACYDKRGAYIIIGIATMFIFQVYENVGMMVGLMPITGITLPFISYGGTSLLINMLSIGIVMSIKLHQEKYDLQNKETTKTIAPGL